MRNSPSVACLCNTARWMLAIKIKSGPKSSCLRRQAFKLGNKSLISGLHAKHLRTQIISLRSTATQTCIAPSKAFTFSVLFDCYFFSFRLHTKPPTIIGFFNKPKPLPSLLFQLFAYLLQNFKTNLESQRFEKFYWISSFSLRSFSKPTSFAISKSFAFGQISVKPINFLPLNSKIPGVSEIWIFLQSKSLILKLDSQVIFQNSGKNRFLFSHREYSPDLLNSAASRF